MKAINVMNFVRQCEPRSEHADALLFPTTKEQIKLVKELDIDNTFLLQYDALCDSKYVELFKNEITDKIEIGLWYEIVKPLTDAIGLPYRSEFGWAWDFHIVPGFSMGYEVHEREMLIDEAMNKFKSVFGYYPKTVASWLIDTHTINYLTDNYDISAMAICRDQMNVDAYTLHGGYFNQAYYPSRKNMFTPAQTDELRVKVPMFRLLGSNPITNYDETKYLSPGKPHAVTMEAAWCTEPNIVDWFYRTYYRNEDMGFSYAQIGQENSFSEFEIIEPIRMQVEKAKDLGDVQFMKMCDTGEWFKKQYPSRTPVTAVVALDNWDEIDVQSVYYDCQNYTVDLFRYGQKIFIRALYKFDESVEDKYLHRVCDTISAVYENLPVVDTKVWDDCKCPCGMYLDYNGEAFRTERISDTELKVSWGDKYVLFNEETIEISNCVIEFYKGNASEVYKAVAIPKIKVSDKRLDYNQVGTEYTVKLLAGTAIEEGDMIKIMPENKKVILAI